MRGQNVLGWGEFALFFFLICFFMNSSEAKSPDLSQVTVQRDCHLNYMQNEVCDSGCGAVYSACHQVCDDAWVATWDDANTAEERDEAWEAHVDCTQSCDDALSSCQHQCDCESFDEACPDPDAIADYIDRFRLQHRSEPNAEYDLTGVGVPQDCGPRLKVKPVTNKSQLLRYLREKRGSYYYP